MIAPRCGCYVSDDDKSPAANDSCLYPALVEAHARAESQLRHAREILKAMLLENAYPHSETCKLADSFLEKTV